MDTTLRRWVQAVSGQWAYLPPLAVNVPDGVGQAVGAQQCGRALWPFHRHQAVLPHQHLSDVLRPRHPNQRPPQKVRLEDVPILLPPGRMEPGALLTDGGGGGGGGGAGGGTG